jgi:hypothetical protein
MRITSGKFPAFTMFIRITIFLAIALTTAKQLRVGPDGPSTSCEGLFCTNTSDCGVSCACDPASWTCVSVK